MKDVQAEILAIGAGLKSRSQAISERGYDAAQKKLQPPSARDAMDAVVRPVDPMAELKKEHEAARRILARQQREDVKLHTRAIEAEHRAAFDELKDRQAAMRQVERAAMFAQTRTVTFGTAKQSLMDDQQKAMAERPFKRAVEPEPEATRPKPDDKEHLPTMEQRLDRPSERPTAAQDFGKAADAGQAAPLSRSDQIRRDMVEWRAKNKDRDLGREL